MKLTRRMVLRAPGVAVALPVLSSLLPRAQATGPAAPIKRFVALFFPNGITMRQDWQTSRRLPRPVRRWSCRTCLRGTTMCACAP